MNHVRFPCADALRGLLWGKAQAVAVVARGLLCKLLSPANLIEALGGAETGKA